MRSTHGARSPVPDRFRTGHGVIGATASVVVLALLLTSCRLVTSGPEYGPEQSRFVVEAGLGMGPDAEDLAGEVLAETRESYIEGTVNHLGTISTPGGRLDLIAFESEDENGNRVQCQGQFNQFGSSWGCGPLPLATSPPDGSAFFADGLSGSDEWSEASLLVSSDVARLTAIASDGFRYELVPGEGRAYVMWPSRRGDLTITAYASDGSTLDTDRVETVMAGP